MTNSGIISGVPIEVDSEVISELDALRRITIKNNGIMVGGGVPEPLQSLSAELTPKKRYSQSTQQLSEVIYARKRGYAILRVKRFNKLIQESSGGFSNAYREAVRNDLVRIYNITEEDICKLDAIIKLRGVLLRRLKSLGALCGLHLIAQRDSDAERYCITIDSGLD